MSTKPWIIASLFIAVFGCINLPHNNQVCPNGSFIEAGTKCPAFEFSKLNLNPESFSVTYLDSSEMNYVRGRGTLIGNITLDNDQWAFVSVSFATPDYERVRFLGVQRVEPDGGSGLPVKSLGNGSYEYNFTAPTVPGNYIVTVMKRSQHVPEKLVGEYRFTVLNETDEAGAFSKADAFIYWNTFMNTSGIDKWNITEKSINSTEDNYEVYIQAKYDVCYIDYDDMYSESPPCDKDNVVFGRYIISKKTGQIIG